MDKLEAIEYVVKNARTSSEWAEAGAFQLVCKIVAVESFDFDWSKEELDELIEEAADY